MPVYEYECESCRIRFERLQHFNDEALKECPECGSPVRRLIQPAGIIFKGSGFYVTDHRQLSSGSNGPHKELEAPKGSEEKKALPSAETKPAEKSAESSTPKKKDAAD